MESLLEQRQSCRISALAWGRASGLGHPGALGEPAPHCPTLGPSWIWALGVVQLEGMGLVSLCNSCSLQEKHA